MRPARANGRPAAADLTDLAGAPLNRAEFAGLMAPLGPWGTGRRVAVAVSGGADSLSLAWLAAGWGRPLGLIVDHGLRPESGVEALQAAERLAGFGVGARILRLHGLHSGPGLAARARVARYDALSRACRAEGLSDLLLGHHAGDQAETVLMRREAHSGRAGLAGMAPVSETATLRLVRPLLGMAAARLRATLRQAGLAWAEDPSNADPAAARTRLRGLLAQDGGLMRAMLEAARQDAGWRHDEEARAAAAVAQRVGLFPEGYAILSPGPVTPDVLAAVIRTLSGDLYPAGGAALARLAAGLPAGTLGGVRFQSAGRLGPGLLAVREAAAVQPPVPAKDGALWDGRFRLRVEGALPQDACLGALAGDARTLRRCSRLPSTVLCTMPALRAPGGALAVPQIGCFFGWTNRRVRLSFEPASPLAGGAFGLGDAQRAVNPHVL